MKAQWYEVTCPNGCFTSYSYQNDPNDTDDTDAEGCCNCATCGSEPVIFTLETSKNPEFFINVACNELEDSNHHGIVSLPEDLYNRIETLIPEDKKLELAKIIYDQFRNL